MRPHPLLLLFVVIGPMAGTSPAHAQCSLEQGPDVNLGTGTGVRIAVDPSWEAPVVLLNDEQGNLVYRRFLGPDWGRPVQVDTGGVHAHRAAFDLVLDEYGRPTVAFWDGTGGWLTRYTDGWSAPEQLLERDAEEPNWKQADARLERDGQGRIHVLYWTNVDGKRTYHAVDDGSGFPSTVELEHGGRSARMVADGDGNLHLTMVGAFDDPDSDLDEYQVYYRVWTPATGWLPNPEVITDEPNPPTGAGAGPVGLSPEIALDSAGAVHVVYPMHDTEEHQVSGEIHHVTNNGGSWSAPAYLFDAWGHGGYPAFAIDARDMKVALGMVVYKMVCVDSGDGFGEPFEWSDSIDNTWGIHDIAQTRGLFWHPYLAADAEGETGGSLAIHTLTKTGTCPGVPGDDLDDDGVVDVEDLCPGFPDPVQGDHDGDGLGDACDPDDDGDGVDDATDVCPWLADPGQEDADGDGLGDACAAMVDDDGDGVLQPWDCDDGDPASAPDLTEDCEDPADNDCDGLADEEDPDCGSTGDDDDSACEGDDDSAHEECPLDDDDTGGCDCDGANRGAAGAPLALCMLALGAWARQRRRSGCRRA